MTAGHAHVGWECNKAYYAKQQKQQQNHHQKLRNENALMHTFKEEGRLRNVLAKTLYEFGKVLVAVWDVYSYLTIGHNHAQILAKKLTNLLAKILMTKYGHAHFLFQPQACVAFLQKCYTEG